MSQTLPFTRDEYDGRLERVRARMRERGIDLLMTHSPQNMCYLSGFSTIGIFEYACLVVPLEGEPVMVVRGLERPLARARVWVDELVTYGDADDPIATAAAVALRWSPRHVGLERTVPSLTVARHAALTAALGASRVADGDGLVEAVRLVKSPAEIAYLREAARQTDASMSAAFAAIAEGASENDVAIAMYAAGIGAGSDYPSNPHAVLSGERTGLPHTTWSGRRLGRGDLVYLVASACAERYTTAIFRTAAVGRASDEHRRYADVVAQALETTKAAIKPGAVSNDVDVVCHSVFERAGLAQWHPHRAGYSMGISFPPHVGEVTVGTLRRGSDLVLEPGMVWHVFPALFKPGELGIGISETVLVTESGSEYLGALPRRLVEAGR